MAERTHIPTSPACGHWETLLADALDSQLLPVDEAVFSSHMAGCARCTELFDEASRGREWLSFLSPEPEIPADLVEKILARTGPGHRTGHAVVSGGAAAMHFVPAWQRPGFMGQLRGFAEPRLMLTAAMAFFSIALTLNLTGVRLTSFRFADLRPAAIRSHLERSLTMASVPIVRYYDHLRLVYEVESRVRELRGASEDNQDNNQPAPPAGPGQSRRQKDGGSHVDPPQQSGDPARQPFAEYLETSLTIHTSGASAGLCGVTAPAHSGVSAWKTGERKIAWIA